MTEPKEMDSSSNDSSRRTSNLRGFHRIRRVRLSNDKSQFLVYDPVFFIMNRLESAV